jgi:hypothetical protein
MTQDALYKIKDRSQKLKIRHKGTEYRTTENRRQAAKVRNQRPGDRSYL